MHQALGKCPSLPAASSSMATGNLWVSSACSPSSLLCPCPCPYLHAAPFPGCLWILFFPYKDWSGLRLESTPIHCDLVANGTCHPRPCFTPRVVF